MAVSPRRSVPDDRLSHCMAARLQVFYRYRNASWEQTMSPLV